jgi:hypothetical protein
MAFGTPKKKPFKDQTFREKLGTMRGNAMRAFKKAAAVTLIGGAVIGGPAYYNYGTIQEQEVTVRTMQKDYVRYDSEESRIIYDNMRIVTDRGTFRNEDAMLHMKFNAEQIQSTTERGKVYRIKSYGHLPFGLVGSPNIISMQEVTADELAERERERQETIRLQEEERLKNAPAVTPVAANANGQPVAATGPTAAALSGAMTKVVITAEGYDIQLTVPAEVVNSIRVDKVTETRPVHIIQAPRPPGG